MASRPPPLPNDNQHDRCTTKLVMISTEGHCVCCCWCCCCCWSYIDFSFCDSLTAPCCPAAITLPWAVHVPLPFHNCAFAHPSLRHMYIFLFFFFLFWLTTARIWLGFGSSSLSGWDSGIWLGFGSNVAIWLLLMNHASLLNHASARTQEREGTESLVVSSY